MQRRLFSAILFLFALLVMALSYFSAFFHLTDLNIWVVHGLAVFGFILALVSFFMLSAGGEADDFDDPRRQWLFYGLGLFLYGLTDMVTGTFSIFFNQPAADISTAVFGVVGGLTLCLVTTLFLTTQP